MTKAKVVESSVALTELSAGLRPVQSQPRQNPSQMIKARKCPVEPNKLMLYMALFQWTELVSMAPKMVAIGAARPTAIAPMALLFVCFGC